MTDRRRGGQWRLWFGVAASLAALTPDSGRAKVIGTMTPARPVTEAAIAALPAPQQAAWRAWLERSQALRKLDDDALAAERAGLAEVPPPPPPGKSGGGGMPLDRARDWYGMAPALLVADNIVSFQTASGGWGKNQDRDRPPRQRGQTWVIAENEPGAQDHYRPTIDNNATITEIRFLALVQRAIPAERGEVYRRAALRGIEYLLAAQMPNGGFAQIYPLEGWYHDALTFNDDAFVEVAELLRAVSAGADGFDFVSPALRARARQARDRATALMVAAQVRIGGRRTIWAQQYDALSLQPAGARNFEPASLAVAESAGVLRYLMKEPGVEKGVIADGIAFLRGAAITDHAWIKGAGGGPKALVFHPGAAPIWPRYIALDGRTALFGDRDRTIHDDVAELSAERRDGYAWYGTWAAAAIKAFDKAR
jgi:PelA/Pel-15E family pectate lyase